MNPNKQPGTTNMTETDASHPTLLAVARGTSTVALIVTIVALGGIMIRLLPSLQPCPMGPIGPLGQMGLYPLQTSPGRLSCVADLTATHPAQTGSGHLPAAVKPVAESVGLIVAFLVAATVRVAIARLWPSLRPRAEQTEDNA
jgi:hypothetical protein